MSSGLRQLVITLSADRSKLSFLSAIILAELIFSQAAITSAKAIPMQNRIKWSAESKRPADFLLVACKTKCTSLSFRTTRPPGPTVMPPMIGATSTDHVRLASSESGLSRGSFWASTTSMTDLSRKAHRTKPSSLRSESWPGRGIRSTSPCSSSRALALARVHMPPLTWSRTQMAALSQSSSSMIQVWNRWKATVMSGTRDSHLSLPSRFCTRCPRCHCRYHSWDTVLRTSS
mmetsp:Transcript_10443/g.22942  ORF Transcript_10443/g.22942 Transcript_10443/m.22942 type:complete len:232 (+) Transcript_10443:662-1357(+)